MINWGNEEYLIRSYVDSAFPNYASMEKEKRSPIFFPKKSKVIKNRKKRKQ